MLAFNADISELFELTKLKKEKLQVEPRNSDSHKSDLLKFTLYIFEYLNMVDFRLHLVNLVFLISEIVNSEEKRLTSENELEVIFESVNVEHSKFTFL